MNALINSIIATVIVSLLSFIGIVSLIMKKKLLNKILILMVGFSAGALMGGAFLHLIPEALEMISISRLGLYLLTGFGCFFLIERGLHWHHCHKHGIKCDVHTLGYMNLVGDGVHNFIDGIIIAGGFLISVPVGIATSIAIISHEIPQEMGDFAVLLYSGFKTTKALLFNFFSALLAVVGAIVGYMVAGMSEMFMQFIIPFAAGGFIYIAASDLIPELHKEADLKKSLGSFGLFIVGILFMLMVKMIFEG